MWNKEEETVFISKLKSAIQAPVPALGNTCAWTALLQSCWHWELFSWIQPSSELSAVNTALCRFVHFWVCVTYKQSVELFLNVNIVLLWQQVSVATISQGKAAEDQVCDLWQAVIHSKVLPSSSSSACRNGRETILCTCFIDALNFLFGFKCCWGVSPP